MKAKHLVKQEKVSSTHIIFYHCTQI